MPYATIDLSLQDALYQLSLAQPVPDAELLDQIVRENPQHAEALTAFAIELAIDALIHREDEQDVPGPSETVSPAVSRAMSQFLNELYSVREAQKQETSQGATNNPPNPFEPLDRGSFRALANNIDANVVFLSKLRDRLVEPSTIPYRFQQKLAVEMEVPAELLAAHLAGPLQVRAGAQFFKADAKPTIQAQQTYEDAVRNSGLSPEQQEHLLALRD